MASELATGVDEVLGRYQVEIDRATTAALVVQPKTRWRKGESVRTGWFPVWLSTKSRSSTSLPTR